TDLLTGKVLASNVKVSAVSGSAITTGTANTVVTLSTGQYGSQQYLIQVTLGGMYKNCQQTGPYTIPGSTTPVCAGSPVVATNDPAYQAAHPLVTVMIPPTVNTIQAVGQLAHLTTAAGLYKDATPVSYSVGMQYNNKGTNPQGQVQLVLEQGTDTY